jgi:hypothetical protein
MTDFKLPDLKLPELSDFKIHSTLRPLTSVL